MDKEKLLQNYIDGKVTREEINALEPVQGGVEWVEWNWVRMKINDHDLGLLPDILERLVEIEEKASNHLEHLPKDTNKEIELLKKGLKRMEDFERRLGDVEGNL